MGVVVRVVLYVVMVNKEDPTKHNFADVP